VFISVTYVATVDFSAEDVSSVDVSVNLVVYTACLDNELSNYQCFECVPLVYCRFIAILSA